jgi:hypothetical protein
MERQVVGEIENVLCEYSKSKWEVWIMHRTFKTTTSINANEMTLRCYVSDSSTFRPNLLY